MKTRLYPELQTSSFLLGVYKIVSLRVQIGTTMSLNIISRLDYLDSRSVEAHELLTLSLHQYKLFINKGKDVLRIFHIKLTTKEGKLYNFTNSVPKHILFQGVGTSKYLILIPEKSGVNFI